MIVLVLKDHCILSAKRHYWLNTNPNFTLLKVLRNDNFKDIYSEFDS